MLIGRVTLIVVALVVAFGVQRSDGFATSSGGTICRDVAADVGLKFTGDYGPVMPGGDAITEAMHRNMGNGAAVADVFGDGVLDVLLLGQEGHPNRLFRNTLVQTGRPGFVDVTEEAGLANTGGSRAAVFADLDNDGSPDLIVANDYQPGVGGTPSRIYRNDGAGHFTDVTEGSGFVPTGYIVGGLALADFNRTGRLSIFVSYWTEEAAETNPDVPVRGRFPGHNRLYENLGDFRFRDVTDAVGLGGIHVDTFQTIFTDFDGDLWPDMYIAFDHRADRYYRNVDGRFVDQSRDAGVGNVGNDMGVAAGDLDADGRVDLYSTNITDHDENFGNRPPGNILLMGDGSPGNVHFTDVGPSKGVTDGGWGWGAAFVDLNLDASPDIYTVQGFREFVGALSPSVRDATAKLFLADGAGGFVDGFETGCNVPGDQRALIPFDYDRDGAPDLLITQVALPTMLLANQTSGQHWLTVVPDPAAGLTSGAWVTVRSGGRTQRQLILASSSYLSGMPQEAYFGLGQAAVADEVLVDWQDGRSLRLSSVAADQLIRVTPGGIVDR